MYIPAQWQYIPTQEGIILWLMYRCMNNTVGGNIVFKISVIHKLNIGLGRLLSLSIQKLLKQICIAETIF